MQAIDFMARCDDNPFWNEPQDTKPEKDSEKYCFAIQAVSTFFAVKKNLVN